MIERFSEVLNLHHNYSIFLLIKVFTLKKYNNEQANLLNCTLNYVYTAAFDLSLYMDCYCLFVHLWGRGGRPTKTCYAKVKTEVHPNRA